MIYILGEESGSIMAKKYIVDLNEAELSQLRSLTKIGLAHLKVSQSILTNNQIYKSDN